jgi:hypothetical protein
MLFLDDKQRRLRAFLSCLNSGGFVVKISALYLAPYQGVLYAIFRISDLSSVLTCKNSRIVLPLQSK